MSAEERPARSAANLAVVIASRGRPEELTLLIEQLARQTRPASQVVIALSDPMDGPSTRPPGMNLEVLVSEPGSCRQRNAALDRVLWADTDYVVLIDDDYYPTRTALDDIVRFFMAHPDISGINGRLIADGAGCGGLALREAIELLEAAERCEPPPLAIRPRNGLYGCNMAFRATAIEAVRFDEAPPRYGGQEDVGFSARRGFGGRAATAAFQGVHCGSRGGRTSGVRFGYSQIANPVYLQRKGSISSKEARRLITRALAANGGRLFHPEPWIDRKGRLRGNLVALTDALGGRLRPSRILEIG